METTIYNFYTSFCIPAIQKQAFHIPHKEILGTNNCGDSRRTDFKRRESFQDVLCCRVYSERVVASFYHQIQSEYYGGNRSVYIEGIALEHFSALPQIETNSLKKPCPRHAVFYYYFSYESKQYSDTTTSHSKRLIELIIEQTLPMSTLSKIWGNTDGCAEQYRYASAL